MHPRTFILSTVVGLLAANPVFAATESEDFENVAYYFSAHQDDWQLFMNPQAFRDVSDPRTKVVFVHVTAGDAGLGATSGGRKHPYYLAREHGAEAAIRFMADVGGGPAEASVESVELNGHRVRRVSYRNTVAYFLRLADGHPSGSGFAGTGHESLERLETRKVVSMSAVDGSTIYDSWGDLRATIAALIDREPDSGATIALHIAELDADLNPGDHSDHLATARVALAAARGFEGARIFSYIEYATANMPVNLSPAERDVENGVFTVSVAGILALDHSHHWDDLHRSWIGRSYRRELADPVAAGEGRR